MREMKKKTEKGREGSEFLFNGVQLPVKLQANYDKSEVKCGSTDTFICDRGG